MRAKGELGSPLAVAAFEAVRALVWHTARYEAVPPEELARELEKAAEDVSPKPAICCDYSRTPPGWRAGTVRTRELGAPSAVSGVFQRAR